MKQQLKENYKRFFGNLTKHDGMGRKVGYLNEETLKPSQLEDMWYKNWRRIEINMDKYGFDTWDAVSRIRNPRDLASVLGIDAELLRGVDVREYAEYLGDLIRYTDNEDEDEFWTDPAGGKHHRAVDDPASKYV